jgi:hypothetical protein
MTHLSSSTGHRADRHRGRADPDRRRPRTAVLSSGTWAAGAAGVLALGLGTIGGIENAHGAEKWPHKVSAQYGISFAGFDVGRFDFASEVKGGTYSLRGNAKLSALLGAFKWNGSTNSSGDLKGLEAKPAGYTFDFRSNSKTGSVKLGFNGGRVANIRLMPQGDTHPETVPIEQRHLKDVLDPLTAVLAVTRYEAGNPCTRRLPIFDGKQRFDLVFTFVREERLREKVAAGQPNVGYVCRVRYVPIAGYRMNKETRYMAGNDGIEVGLRAIPEANVLVPYRVTIPTVAGKAVLTSKRVEITTSAMKQIALVD